jgi:hypothetical protein
MLSLLASTTMAAASSIALGQDTTPARETPRPQDVDPAVNTSATPPARETPRPQDLEPGVNTSSPAQSPDAPSRPAAGAAVPGASSSSVPNAASAGASPQSRAGAQASAPTGQPAANTPGQPGAAVRTGPKGKALDRLELDTTQITGNRELPKVLYIVPWKRSDLGDLVGKPVNSLLDEVLTPVDRDVFQRENRYYRALTPGAAANDALSAPDSRPPPPTRSPTPTNSAPAAGSSGSATTGPAKVSTGSGSAAPAPGDEK